MLARPYFETGDFECLKAVNEEFRNYTATLKKGNKIRKKLVYFKFVDLYLAGDFYAAKEIYEKLYLQKKEQKSKVELDDVSVCFTYAVCSFKCGDFAQATQLFNEVITAAPSLHYAEISKRYLEAIEKGTDYLPEPIKLAAEEVNIPIPKSRKVYRIIYAITFFWVLSGVIALIVIGIITPKQPIHFNDLDFYTTRSDVHSLYGKTDELREFDSYDGQYYEVYDVEYLGVEGTLDFIYYIDSDILQKAWFVIDLSRFSSNEEYDAAVDKTCKYFKKTLSKYSIDEQSEEDWPLMTWYNDCADIDTAFLKTV